MAQVLPSARELDDLELLLKGAYAPERGFGCEITLELAEQELPVELVDPEGLPLARVEADGSLEALSAPAYGPFRRLHLSPHETQEAYPGAVTVAVVGPLTVADLEEISARRDGRAVVLLVLAGTGTPQGVTPVGLVRSCLVAAEELGEGTHVVVVPLPSHGDAELDHRLGEVVVANYAGAGEVLATTGEGGLSDGIAAVVAEDQPTEPGRVIFFTGLSGSGKSTLARALMDHLLESGGHTVTSLDGDVVRRNLSAGLTFSKEDRETNIRRIGWVAAEISRHHGIAICSPIAPFASTRQQVRQMVAEAGGEFCLIHVATPLAECERRDRKGLYAKARAGEIPEFTGISSPYQEPTDAMLRIDTTGRTIQDCLAEVLDALDL